MVILTLLWADLEVGRTPETELATEAGKRQTSAVQSAAVGLSRGGRCGPPGRELHSHWVMVCKAIWSDVWIAVGGVFLE